MLIFSREASADSYSEEHTRRIGKKPIHLLEEKEREKVAKIEEQWIDIGAQNKEDVLKQITIGDLITLM